LWMFVFQHLHMLGCQIIQRNTEHQIMLVEQSDLCPAVTYIYNEIYQWLIFYTLTDIHSDD
jgi:hypothetical protein